MLILDTSVVINLLGTGRPRLILQHLSVKAHVPQAVLQEILREPEIKTDASIESLIREDVISVPAVTDEIYETALTLIAARHPDDLGDGEAYAIAHTVHASAAIGIDDRKGRRVLNARWPRLRQHLSIDLIAVASKQAGLSTAQHADLVFFALRNTKMRVPNERREEIAKLIGIDRASGCPSLGTF